MLRAVLRTAASLSCALGLAGCALVDFPRVDTSGGILRAAPERPAVDATTLRLVAWNIERSQRLDTAIEEIEGIEALADADVYALQEISTDAADRLVRVTGHATAHFGASLRPRSGIEFGNTVLARWPVVDARRIALPDGRPRRGAPRAATVADLDVQGRRLRVVSVHTATVLYTPAERLAQARATLEALVDFDGPTVVAGDFNTATAADQDDLRALFRAAGFDWVSQGGAATLDTSWWREALLPRHRLDHVFVRGLDVTGSGVIPTTDASDHLPQWVELEWPSGDGDALDQ